MRRDKFSKRATFRREATCLYTGNMSTIEHPLANGSDLVVLLCTFPSGNEWGEIAQTLLSERLCACVNQVREVTSVYRWQGEIVTNREVVCLFKTRSDRYAELVARLTELHPYDVPEIVRLSVESVNQAYLDWVMTECDETAASSRTDGEASTHELDEV